jgi:pimeloyl-ACP methyl ester carboxylesterase
MRRPWAVTIALAAGVLLAGAGRAAEAPAPPSWWTGFLSGVQSVRLPDGRRMDLYCEGKGAPVVVLDSGLGDGAWSWASVQDQIAAKTRVCSYDRAGYGRSSGGPTPRDSKAIVADLAAVLRAAHVPGPYVVVAHSLGSFDARLFAFTYPKQVAGLVLVDPSADWQMTRMAAVAPKFAASADAAYAGLRPCAESPRPPERAKLCALVPANTPPEAKAFMIEARTPDYYRAVLGEMDVFAKMDSEELVAAREALGPAPLGAKPLVILTAGSTTSPGMTPEDLSAIRKVWITMHDEMAALSSRGVNRIVDGSGHYIHQEKPQVVIDAVSEVVDAVRAAKR